MTLSSRQIADHNISAISFGAMNLSHGYGAPPPEEQAKRLLNEVLDHGYTMIDTAALYGFGANESLIGNAISHRRDEFLLASKCGLHGVNGKRELTNDPAKLKQSCDESLRRLKTDVIDLFYLHRWDKVTPIEDSVGALSDLVSAGKIRHIGLSEVSADTLRKAHAVHPVSALQSEYSLWTREPEIAVLEACRQFGTTFVAFAPLARGFLTGVLQDVHTLRESDLRRGMPRFYPENFSENLPLLGSLREIANELGCTTGQLSMAWLLHVDDRLVAIPGTTDSQHLDENLQAQYVALDPSAIEAVGALINRDTVTGNRYNEKTQAEIDTEQFV